MIETINRSMKQNPEMDSLKYSQLTIANDAKAIQ